MKIRYKGYGASYKRDGTPYEGENILEQFSRDLSNPDKRRIALTELSDGKIVSTIWLGINHRFGDGPPLIFETMVFPKADDWNDLDMQRYSIESEAIKGHQEMVKKWGSC